MAFENDPLNKSHIRLTVFAIPVIGAVLGVFVAAPAYPMLGALIGGATSAGFVLFWFTQVAVSRPSKAAKVNASPSTNAVEIALAAVPFPMLLFDEKGKVRHATVEAEALLDRTLVGLTVSLIFRAPAVLAAVEKALTQEVDETFDFRIRRPRDMTLTATVRTLPVGAQERVSLTLQDSTNRVLVEDARSDFVANASHELRTPLAAISGIVETLQGAAKDDPAAQDRFLGMIRKQTERMTRLVNDLLSLSRIEADENILPQAREDIAALLKEACASMLPLVETAGVNFSSSIPAERITVQGSRDELMQVFVNLIENAIKYAGDAGPVHVMAGVAGGKVRISVSDSGPGIDPDHIPRLTERFYRVDAGASRARGGTGLGLAIVKHIVSRHRGTLKITSKLGEGSDFVVVLPVVLDAT